VSCVLTHRRVCLFFSISWPVERDLATFKLGREHADPAGRHAKRNPCLKNTKLDQKTRLWGTNLLKWGKSSIHRPVMMLFSSLETGLQAPKTREDETRDERDNSGGYDSTKSGRTELEQSISARLGRPIGDVRLQLGSKRVLASAARRRGISSRLQQAQSLSAVPKKYKILDKMPAQLRIDGGLLRECRQWEGRTLHCNKK
jgi:hypothetical protein